ncbi:MAG: metallopeptidase family protein [Patescibacteria group bacterium]
MIVSDIEFDEVISSVMDELPQEYITGMKNVSVVIADDPDEHQRTKLKLRCHETLFGLYEGIPLTKRGSGYSLVLPDKITLFKNPLLGASQDLEQFRENTKRTLWHEIAHHYGLDHKRIHQLENKS